MINFNEDENDLQIVDGNFSIQSGSNDRTAFFNMNPSNMNQYNSTNTPSNTAHFNGGFGSTNFFGSQSKNDQMTTPNHPQQQTGSSQASPNCNGNCAACAWSFLCKKATSGLSIGGSAPKLC